MDNQLSSPNIPAPSERSGGLTPADLKSGVAGAEVAPMSGAEVAPVPGPGAPQAAAPAAAATVKPTAADVAAAMALVTGPVKPVSTPNPQVAADIDVIEPEWVEKAEEVVKAHAGDPYAEEEAIEELQQDYLQKRYGINVGDPDAGDTKPKGV